jgi:hypothetical protein
MHFLFHWFWSSVHGIAFCCLLFSGFLAVCGSGAVSLEVNCFDKETFSLVFGKLLKICMFVCQPAA